MKDKKTENPPDVAKEKRRSAGKNGARTAKLNSTKGDVATEAKKANVGQNSKPNRTKKVHCMLPGAELLDQGLSPQEVMEELEKKGKIELSPEHEIFCIELSVENNQTKAYMRAYPDSGYNAAAASATALLKNPKIKARVEQLRDERKARLNLDGDKLLQMIYNNAHANMRDLYRPDGSLIPITELHPDIAATIQQIEIEEIYAGRGDERTAIGVVKKYKLVDRLKAAELVGRNLMLWKDAGTKENPFHFDNMTDVEIDSRLKALESKE